MAWWTKLIIIVLSVILLLIGGIAAWIYFGIKQPAKRMIEFISEHPDKVSLTIVKDGKIEVDLTGTRPMPLASTVKLVIAYEYAVQAASGEIDPDENVRLDALDRYYIPNTDGGAHPAWLKAMEDAGLTKDGEIPLRETVKGMIKYSSNANADFLLDKLGIDRVNETVSNLSFTYHDPVFPIASSMLMPGFISETERLNAEDTAARLKNMNADEYRRTAEYIKDELKHGRLDEIKANPLMPMQIQHIWSSRFTASTTRDYALLMDLINKGTGLSQKEHEIIKDVLEWEVKGTGEKGGSTAFVLNNAVYTTTKDGTAAAYALFMNNLTEEEYDRLFNIHPLMRIVYLPPFDAFAVNMRNRSFIDDCIEKLGG